MAEHVGGLRAWSHHAGGDEVHVDTARDRIGGGGEERHPHQPKKKKKRRKDPKTQGDASVTGVQRDSHRLLRSPRTAWPRQRRDAQRSPTA